MPIDFEKRKEFIDSRLIPEFDEKFIELGFKKYKKGYIKEIEDFYLALEIDYGHPRLKNRITIYISLIFPVINYGLSREQNIFNIPSIMLCYDIINKKQVNLTYNLYITNDSSDPQNISEKFFDDFLYKISNDITCIIYPISENIIDGNSAYNWAFNQQPNLKSNTFMWAVLEFFYGEKEASMEIFKNLKAELNSFYSYELDRASNKKHIEQRYQLASDNLKTQIIALSKDYEIDEEILSQFNQ